MTDRELLENAAKAAGIEFSEMGGGSRYAPRPGVIQPYIRWNPLTDDGDALRLAVKLQMDLTLMAWRSEAQTPDHRSVVEPAVNADPYAATRRAIVRAAAEIGRSMV